MSHMAANRNYIAGMRKAGLIMSWIGIIIGIVVSVILMIFVITTFQNAINTINSSAQEASEITNSTNTEIDTNADTYDFSSEIDGFSDTIENYIQ